MLLCQCQGSPCFRRSFACLRPNPLGFGQFGWPGRGGQPVRLSLSAMGKFVINKAHGDERHGLEASSKRLDRQRMSYRRAVATRALTFELATFNSARTVA